MNEDTLNNFYGLGFPIKSFSVANQFVLDTNKACYKLGQNLIPFCIYGNADQCKESVVDFSNFTGLVDSGKGLVEEVAKYRAEGYRDIGILLDVGSEDVRRTLFYDFLLSTSLCYVELPKTRVKNGKEFASYDKFFCTRNPAILGAWMGCSKDEMQAKFSARIQARSVELLNTELRVVQCFSSIGENSVTVLRSTLSSRGMICIPVYMLHAFLCGLRPLLDKNIISFQYLKDNGTVRELTSTLNYDTLMYYYKDAAFVNSMLSHIDSDSVKQGSLTLSRGMHRGYIRLPELGASMYDSSSGVRALNIARLLSIKLCNRDEVDTSFIHVDLNSVIPSFCNGIDNLLKENPSSIVEIYRLLVQEEPNISNMATLSEVLKSWVRDRGILLSTTFFRSMHMFLMEHRDWFPDYTGSPIDTVSSFDRVNLGVSVFDF